MLQRELRTSGATRLIRPLLALVAASGMLTLGMANAQVRVETPEQSRMINEHLSKAWADNKITKAKPATDDEFIRRVFLDVIGRIPMGRFVAERTGDDVAKSPQRWRRRPPPVNIVRSRTMFGEAERRRRPRLVSLRPIQRADGWRRAGVDFRQSRTGRGRQRWTRH